MSERQGGGEVSGNARLSSHEMLLIVFAFLMKGVFRLLKGIMKLHEPSV